MGCWRINLCTLIRKTVVICLFGYKFLTSLTTRRQYPPPLWLSLPKVRLQTTIVWWRHSILLKFLGARRYKCWQQNGVGLMPFRDRHKKAYPFKIHPIDIGGGTCDGPMQKCARVELVTWHLFEPKDVPSELNKLTFCLLSEQLGLTTSGNYRMLSLNVKDGEWCTSMASIALIDLKKSSSIGLKMVRMSATIVPIYAPKCMLMPNEPFMTIGGHQSQ